MWNLSSKIPYLVCYLILLTYNNPHRNRLPNYPDKEMPNSKKRIAETISVTQLLRIFPDNESCVKWMEKMRWNGKPTCAHCGGTEQVSDPPSKPNAYWCGICRLHFFSHYWNDIACNQDSVAKLDRSDLQRNHSKERRQLNATVKRNWRSVPYCLVYALPDS